MKVKKETVVIGYIFYQLEGGYNKSFQQDKKQLVFARASLILTSYFIASE
jgi:hypothetical protein